MKQDVALLLTESGQRGRGGLVAGFGTFQNLADFDVIALLDNRADLIQETGRHHHDDFVDEWGLMHRGDGVLDDRLASNLDQLLGNVQADAGASTPGQDHGNVAQSGHRLTLPPQSALFLSAYAATLEPCGNPGTFVALNEPREGLSAALHIRSAESSGKAHPQEMAIRRASPRPQCQA